MQDLPLDRLGPFPLIQLAAAILVIGGLALAIYRGTRDRRKSLQEPLEQHLFFDGPLNAALQSLRDLYGCQKRLIENTNPMAEEQRKQTKLLQEIKDGIDDLMPQRKRR